MPTSWDTCGAHLPGRVWGLGTGLDLAVWAGVVLVLFGSVVLLHLPPSCHLHSLSSALPQRSGNLLRPSTTPCSTQTSTCVKKPRRPTTDIPGPLRSEQTAENWQNC